MLNASLRLIAGLTLISWCASLPAAVVTYNETVDPELSGDNEQPTNLGIFGAGANTVIGQVTAIGTFPSLNGTADVFTFEIPVAATLDSIFLTDFSTGSGSAAFFAFDDASTFPYADFDLNDPLFDQDISLVLGGNSYGINQIGADIMPLIGSSGRGAGFTGSLGPGQYTMYIQETGPFSNYSLTFNVSSVAAVPEPSSFAVLVIAAASAGVLIRRRKLSADARVN